MGRAHHRRDRLRGRRAHRRAHRRRPDDPISITREEFEDALDQLAEIGASIKADREQAWRDFAGWRVNYDTVLLALAARTFAPTAPWTSDREPVAYRPAS